MRSKFFISLLFALACVGLLSAHPLGNFSINQFSKLQVTDSKIEIRQVLDMAEIPTFQETAKIDTDKDGEFSAAELAAYARNFSPDYLVNLRLTVNGVAVPLIAGEPEATINRGAGDLATLRIVWNLSANIEQKSTAASVNFRNFNFEERVGWNEMVVKHSSAVNVFDSNAYGSELSDELKAYPGDSLAAPLNERTAAFSVTKGPIPANAKPLMNRDGHETAAVQTDRLAALISAPEITPSVAILGLLLAVGLGAIHAMSPGHGKTVVGAYLIGSKGTPKHAAFLGLTVTITHTLGVFALGLITLFASNYILPERLMPFLSFVSGLLVFYIGITLFKNRIFSVMGWSTTAHSHHHHSHEDGDGHPHDGLTHTHDGNTHTHQPPESISWRNLLALGISGGLLPCPSALVLMLSAIYIDRVGYGLILTVAFSIGLAATLTAVGFAFLYLGKILGKRSFAQHRIIKTLPAFSALVIACIGAFMCYNSLG
ncbi:MAG: nickel/cobalt transporter, partial [Pyrinomonadaceae bacterium]